MRAGERRVDQIADIRMARMHRELIALLYRRTDFVDVREVEFRRHALRVEIERDVNEVEVAGALAVAEEAAFEPVGTGHQCELAGGSAGTAVVVRVHRQHDRLAPLEVTVHPFDHVGKDVGRRVLYRSRQIDDAFELDRRPPNFSHRIDDAL